MLTYNPKIPKCKINDTHIKQIVKAPNQLRLGAFIVKRHDKLGRNPRHHNRTPNNNSN